MITEPTTVKGNDGKEVPAHVAKCSVCSGDTFHLFIVNGHNHIQCANPVCNETYCQGGCENAGCDRCGIDDREEGSTLCEHCGKEDKHEA